MNQSELTDIRTTITTLENIHADLTTITKEIQHTIDFLREVLAGK